MKWLNMATLFQSMANISSVKLCVVLFSPPTLQACLLAFNLAHVNKKRQFLITTPATKSSGRGFLNGNTYPSHHYHALGGVDSGWKNLDDGLGCSENPRDCSDPSGLRPSGSEMPLGFSEIPRHCPNFSTPPKSPTGGKM